MTYTRWAAKRSRQEPHTRSHPHNKPLVGQACSLDVGETRTSPEGSQGPSRVAPLPERRLAPERPANGAGTESDSPPTSDASRFNRERSADEL